MTKIFQQFITIFYKRVIIKDNDVIHEDPSVKKVRMSQQQPLKVSLEECLQLFTRDEKVEPISDYILIIYTVTWNHKYV